MFKKIKDSVKKFFSDVFEDIKKLDIQSIFTNPKLLIIAILLLIAIIIVFTNIQLTILIKGLGSLIIFYFVFLWRKN